MKKNFILTDCFGKSEKRGYISLLASAMLIFWLLGLFMFFPSACAQEPSFNEATSFIRSPASLVSWLSCNFRYELKLTDDWQTPQETFAAKKGDCDDFALLAQSILGRSGISSEVVVIKFRGLSVFHAVCVFREADGTVSFISNTELYRSGKRTTQEALKKFYPDLESIIPFSKIAQSKSYRPIASYR